MPCLCVCRAWARPPCASSLALAVHGMGDLPTRNNTHVCCEQVILMAGLQGVGKTTACGKLALALQKRNKKVPPCVLQMQGLGFAPKTF